VKNYWKILELYNGVKNWRPDLNKYLTGNVGVNRTFFADYLKALEKQGYIGSKRKNMLKFFRGDIGGR
jgi:hypothetical protein